MKQKLWLDVIYSPPGDEWYWARTLSDAQSFISRFGAEVVSLGHSFYAGEELSNGISLVKWMIEENVWPRTELAVHTQNRQEAKHICVLIASHGPYKEKIGKRIFRQSV